MKESRKAGPRPRIADLARLAGVSVSTVDRVINGRDPVRAGTAEKVVAAAQTLGFQGAPRLSRQWSPARPTLRLGFLLLQKHRDFYQSLGREIAQAAQAFPGANVTAQLLHAENLAPTAVAAQIRALGHQADAVAVVSANHPLVSAALEDLAARQVPAFGLISELTAGTRLGYVGLDNHAVGRTAAWFMAQMAQAPGKVAVVVGTHRFRCQDQNESGFRSYFREHAAAGFEVIEPGATLEDDAAAAEIVRHLLKREPGLRGLYVAGGGIGGVVSALREEAQPGRIVVIGNDRTTAARAGLLEGHLRLTLSHPLPALCTTLIARMADAVRGDPEALAPCFFNTQIETPENVR